MSIRSKALRWNESGDPTLTIVVVGVHDVYRLATHLQTGQVEFCEMGDSIKKAVKRRLGKYRWDWLLRYMHGDGGFR